MISCQLFSNKTKDFAPQIYRGLHVRTRGAYLEVMNNPKTYGHY